MGAVPADGHQIMSCFVMMRLEVALNCYTSEPSYEVITEINIQSLGSFWYIIVFFFNGRVCWNEGMTERVTKCDTLNLLLTSRSSVAPP